MQDEYSVYEAKAKLSEILRTVKARREVTITERGHRIARVVPYSRAGHYPIADRLAELKKAGLIQARRPATADTFDSLRAHVRSGAVERFVRERG
jgi:prevent-host-death family protein